MKLFLRILAPLLLLGASGCQPGLDHQPKGKPYGSSAFYANGAVAQSLPEGVVVHRRRGDGPDATPALTPDLLRQGADGYRIYCAVCHGGSGYGDGIAAQRGFTHMPSLHAESARALPLPALLDLLRRGRGRMLGFSGKATDGELFAIAHFVRALQLSQRAPVEALNAEDRAALRKEAP